jgi:hypothetical protein
MTTPAPISIPAARSEACSTPASAFEALDRLQAPYVVNAGITYATASGGSSATLLFNRVGDRIDAAGDSPLPDVVELARNVLDFLKQDFVGLERRYCRVTGTTFRTFPSYPQRYVEVVTDQPVVEPGVRVEPVRQAASPTRYTAADLDVREFSPRASRRLQRSVAA